MQVHVCAGYFNAMCIQDCEKTKTCMCTAYQGPPYQSRRAARRRRAGRAAAGPLRASTAARRAVMRGTPAPTTLDPRPDPARRTSNQAVRRSHQYSDPRLNSRLGLNEIHSFQISLASSKRSWYTKKTWHSESTDRTKNSNTIYL